MADPTESGPRSDRSISGLEWTIIALGLGLALILLVGGLLPARERERKIREENERMADEVLEIDRENRKRVERVDGRKNDRLTIEQELRKAGGLRPGEIPLPPDAAETEKKAAEKRTP